MDCQAVRDRLRSGELERGEPLDEHLRHCPACRELFADDGALGRALGAAAPTLVAEPGAAQLHQLRSAIEVRVARERGASAWLRSRPTWQRLAICVAAFGLLLAVFAFVVPRHPLAEGGLGRFALVAAGLGALLLGAVWRLLRPLQAPPPPRVTTLLLLVGGVGTPIVLAFFPPTIHELAPGATGPAGLGAAVSCAGLGLVAVVPLWLLATTLRRVRVDGAAVTALAGVAAGLGALVCLQIHCHHVDLQHLLLGHASLVWLAAVFAAGAGARRATRAS